VVFQKLLGSLLFTIYTAVYNNLTAFFREADDLKNEAKLHSLKHVNVVTLYAMVFEPHHYGIVLEFVRLGCLEDFIRKYKVLFKLTYLIFRFMKLP